MNRLLVRALVAFIALPGVVVFVVPLFALRREGTAFSNWWGAPLGAGTMLLLLCVREFYAAGRGTLAPWSPPTSLVTTGPYEWSRNPMYIAVLLILAGWAIGFRSWPITLYAFIVMIAFHLRVLLHEEPWLARTFGEVWPPYRQRVSRWL